MIDIFFVVDNLNIRSLQTVKGKDSTAIAVSHNGQVVLSACCGGGCRFHGYE